MNEMLNRLGMNAKAAETEMRNLSTNKKNEVLLAVADKLVKDAQTLIMPTGWMWKPEKGIICLMG